MTTTEDDRIIAEFMGFNFNRFENDGIIEPQEEVFFTDYKTFTLDELRFSKDWNWLMEVVDRINKTGRFEVVIQYGFCYITDEMDELTLSFPASNTIKATYQAVVEFIKWYNKKIKL